MSLSSRSLVPTSSRLGSLGIFSIGVIAFALTTLQGCASPMVTASSAIEPGAPVPGLGHARADEPTHVEPRYMAASRASERVEARSQASRVSRHDSCPRCSN